MRMQQEQQYVDYVAASLPWLHRLAQNLSKDAARADDIVQAAITKLYVHWARAQRSDNLDAYVRKILVRTFLSERRLRWSDVELIAEAPDAAAPSGREVETRLVVERALSQVPPRQRAVLVLRFLHDLPVRDVAEILNCSEGNVKSQTARGLDRIRPLLSGDHLLSTEGSPP